MISVPVHVEVLCRSDCFRRDSDILPLVQSFLEIECPVLTNGEVSIQKSADLILFLESIRISDLALSVSFWQAELLLHIIRLSEQPPEKDCLDGEDNLPATELWELPNRMLNGLWESIIVESSIKQRLLGYCGTSIQFADAGVDPSIISWNRMVLLHGPPGYTTTF